MEAKQSEIEIRGDVSGEPEWLEDKRGEFWKQFLNTPEPDERDEMWRQSEMDGYVLDIEPSEFRLEIEAPDGVTAAPIKDALNNETLRDHIYTNLEDPAKFSLLAAAAWTGGYFIHVPAETEAEVTVRNLMDSTALSHSVIVLGEGADVSVREIFEGDPGVHYGNLETFIGDNARLDLTTVQRFDGETWDCTYKLGRVGRDGQSRLRFALFGGRASRLEETHVFDGPGSDATIEGIYFGNSDQHFSVLTTSDHRVGNTSGQIDTRGVLRGESNSLARGLIRIGPDGEGTESFLDDRILHMSDEAQSDAIPCLEIENNDVRASHASTTGKIDDRKLYYLESRGLSRREAERLVIEGFFEPVVGDMDEETGEEVREKIKEKIGERDD